MNCAVIDLGSNTIRLSVFNYAESKLAVVLQQKEVAGLHGYIKKGRIEPDGIQKVCSVLSEFKQIALRFVSEENIHVFATASLRSAANREQVLETIRQTIGFLPEVLSGDEEARLDFIGASHFTQCRDGLLVDIGGASTEFVRFVNAQPERLASIPVGCLNLYTKFVQNMTPTEKEQKKIKKEIRRQLDLLGWYADEHFPLIIGIGGTVRAAYKLSCGLFSLPPDQHVIDAHFIKEILDKLKNNEDEIYHTVYKYIPERTLTIFTGLMVFQEVIKRFGCKSIFVSGYGVREGYFMDRIVKEGDAGRAGNIDGYDGIHAEPGTVLAEIQ